MLKKKSIKKILIPFLFLALLLLLPASITSSLRNKMPSILHPLWKGASVFQKKESEGQKELSALESENHLLKLETGRLKAMLDHCIASADSEDSPFSVAATVLYRDPSSWSSTLWIDGGENLNRKLGKELIQVNSPVIVGKCIVGVIDYVGKKQSRVRLITDSSLKPSVRVVRGGAQHLFIIEQIDALLKVLRYKNDPQISEYKQSVQSLVELKMKLTQNSEGGVYLAKGILQGRGSPLWRAGGSILKGIGFNYDFSDEEGGARDLRTGKTLDGKGEAQPLIKIGDLLVTTGMDGVFPAGFKVAYVTKIHSLREGGYAFDLEAAPAVGSLNRLFTVFILSPLGYDLCDKAKNH